MDDDRFDLSRFVDAQAGAYETALAELRAGRKRSHWMWFIFPQIAGLGSSAMSQRYAVGSVSEARAYLDHPLLGARLRELVEVVMQHRDRSAHDIFGSPDDMKFRSCLTLFEQVAPDDVFSEGLGAFFAGKRDQKTLQLVGAGSSTPS